MNITTATPAEIDTEIVELVRREAVLDRDLTAAFIRVRQANGETPARDHYGRTSWPTVDSGMALATLADKIRNHDFPDELARQTAIHAFNAMDAITDTVLHVRAGLAALDREYDRRGGWTRYYLVDNPGGHVHSSTACSSCYRTTSFHWLVSESGKTAEEVVETAGERACTVCFPWAPVETLSRPTGYHSPTELERQAAAAERAAKAAVRRAKEITNPDGSPLRIRERGHGETIKTARAAEIKAVDILFVAKVYACELTAENTANLALIFGALAAKHDSTVEIEAAAAQKRLIARCKREGITA